MVMSCMVFCGQICSNCSSVSFMPVYITRAKIAKYYSRCSHKGKFCPHYFDFANYQKLASKVVYLLNTFPKSVKVLTGPLVTEVLIIQTGILPLGSIKAA